MTIMNRFKVTGKNSVTDRKTGLEWKRRPLDGTPWYATTEACAKMGNGWRVPSMSDMLTILDETSGQYGNLVANHRFLAVPCYYYWTTTEEDDERLCINILDMGVIHLNKSYMSYRFHVWPVRDIDLCNKDT